MLELMVNVSQPCTGGHCGLGFSFCLITIMIGHLVVIIWSCTMYRVSVTSCQLAGTQEGRASVQPMSMGLFHFGTALTSIIQQLRARSTMVTNSYMFVMPLFTCCSRWG